MNEINHLPDLGIHSAIDLDASYLVRYAINRSLLDVSVSAIHHAVTMLTKASTNDPKLDIFYRNISTHIEEGVSVQSDEQEILHDIYKTQKGQQLYEHEHGSITSWLIAKSNKDQKDNYR